MHKVLQEIIFLKLTKLTFHIPSLNFIQTEFHVQ